MKQILSWCLLVVSIYFAVYQLYRCGIWVSVFVLALYAIPILGIFLVARWSGKSVDKKEREIGVYLDACDEKLKKGEMTKEENEDIHFYYECEYNY